MASSFISLFTFKPSFQPNFCCEIASVIYKNQKKHFAAQGILLFLPWHGYIEEKKKGEREKNALTFLLNATSWRIIDRGLMDFHGILIAICCKYMFMYHPLHIQTRYLHFNYRLADKPKINQCLWKWY